MLTKQQLQAIISHAIECQQNILKRTDGHDDWNAMQFYYFKRLYKTAFHYFCGESGYCVDGVAMLDYSELIEMNELLEGRAA
jgi:hypothetical protein